MTPVDIAAVAQHHDCPVCGGDDEGCFHLEVLRNVSRCAFAAAWVAGWRLVQLEVEAQPDPTFPAALNYGMEVQTTYSIADEWMPEVSP